MKSKMVLGNYLAGTALVFSLILVPSIAMAVTDSTLTKPALQRYDLGGKSYTAPFNDVVNINEGEKMTLAGSSFPGAKVTLIVGTKSIVADVVSSGSWAADIKADDIPTGSDSIVGQSISGAKTSELANLLKIKLAGAETESEGTNGLLGNPYVLGGLGLLAVAILAFLAIRFNVFSGLTKKKSKKK